MPKGYKAFIAIVALSLAATPLVMSAGKALATSEPADVVATSVAVMPVEAAPVAASVATEGCARKVRVVYSGYAANPACR